MRAGVPNGRAGVVVPMIVKPENVAFRVGHPYQLWNGIRQGVELTLACRQRRFRAFPPGNLFGGDVDADNFAKGGAY